MLCRHLSMDPMWHTCPNFRSYATWNHSTAPLLQQGQQRKVYSQATPLHVSFAENYYYKTIRWPTKDIFSPPCRTITISPASECIYMQKLKDIAVLNRETSKKDEELTRLKKLAEAEVITSSWILYFMITNYIVFRDVDTFFCGINGRSYKAKWGIKKTKKYLIN